MIVLVQRLALFQLRVPEISHRKHIQFLVDRAHANFRTNAVDARESLIECDGVFRGILHTMLYIVPGRTDIENTT